MPPREAWPAAPAATPAGAAMTEVVLTTFRLNAALLDAAQALAAAGGMTAAWWQVLGGVLDEPRSIADIGRRMGVTPQGVRRVANILVERGLAEYVATPVDTRTRLLACTEAGYWAIRRIAVVTHPWADEIGAGIGAARLEAALAVLRELVELVEGDEHRPPASS